MFQLQSRSMYSPFDAIHLSKHFFHCSKRFSTHQFLCLLVLLLFSLFHFFHFGKCFPLRTFSTRETNKNSLSGAKIRWIGRVDHVGFGQKLLNTQHGKGRCTCKSPIMKWTNTLKETSEKFTEGKCSLLQQCQLVHWYRWVPRTLT